MNAHNFLLLLEEITFRFSKNSAYFFKDISLRLNAGKCYFLSGKNGIGKSTFFRILQGEIGQDEECSGKLILNNECFDVKRDRSYGNYVRLLHQDVDTMLADMFTVQQNLQCALLPKYPGLRGLPLVAVSDLLTVCGIGMHQVVSSLSGGQRQIMAIIMALQKPTHLLLLDEPTAALDADNAVKVMDFIKTIAQTRNLVVIIISHDNELVEKYTQSDNCLVLEAKEGLRFIRKK